MAESSWWEKLLAEYKDETVCLSELYRRGCPFRVCNFKHFHNDERHVEIVNLGRAKAELKHDLEFTVCRYGFDCHRMDKGCHFLHPYDEVQEAAWENGQEAPMMEVPHVESVDIPDAVKAYVNFLALKKFGVDLLP
jgi:hypothetical protein